MRMTGWPRRGVFVFVVVSVAFLFAELALAESVEGVVRLVGSAASAVTVLSDSEGKQLANLCNDDQAKTIGRLTGMTVKAEGAWQEPSKGEVRCFKLVAFDVTKVGSGRDALVGTLTEVEGGFEVLTAAGDRRFLLRVPKGLRKLKGKRVIVDVKPMGSPSMKREAYKVVTFAPFPD